MRVLITGGTGAIGRRLIPHLFDQGHIVTVVSRRPFKPATLPAKIEYLQWDGRTAKGWGEHLEEVDAIVNLAGAGIADARWSAGRKKELLDSRVNAAQAVVEAVNAAENKPKVLIQGSAVGYYGTQNDGAITESAGPGSDFLAQLCVQWEAASEPVEAAGLRRAIIRTGVVLDTAGGALPKMIAPFRFFIGGSIGSGRQWFPWIHYHDEVAAISFLIENEAANGPFNLTALKPLTNRDFAKVIGQVIGRPAFAPAPSPVFKAMFGEMSTVLLEGQRALPGRLEELGFQFEFSTAEEALTDLLGS